MSTTYQDASTVKPGPMGWGLDNQSLPEIRSGEAKAFDALVASVPERCYEKPARDYSTSPIYQKAIELMKADGIEDGFSFRYLEKALFGQELKWLAQTIGSCFPAGTLVRMADGSEKEIQDIQVGDEVIGHTGKARKVLDTMRRRYTGDLCTIKAFGHPFELVATSDHKIGTVPWSGSKFCLNYGNVNRNSIKWTEAGNLKADHGKLNDRLLVGIPTIDESCSDGEVIDLATLIGCEVISTDEIRKCNAPSIVRPEVTRDNMIRHEQSSGESMKDRLTVKNGRWTNAIYRHIAVNKSLCRLLGLFVAEGGVDKTKRRVTFTFHENELHTLAAETLALIKECFGVEAYVSDSGKNGRCTVRSNSMALALAFSKLSPGNVWTKSVPLCVWRTNKECRMAFLTGWIDGDGTYKTNKKWDRMVGVSVSRNLASGVYSLALSCGLVVSGRVRKARKQSKAAVNIECAGESVREIQGGISESQPSIKKHRFGLARKVQYVIKNHVENALVYDFEVEEDHSFIANGLVVHNCVASGWMRAHFARCMAEITLIGQPEEFFGTDKPDQNSANSLCAFAPFNYGIGRQIGGIDNGGDGSFCSAHVQGALQFGSIPCWTAGLTQYSSQFPEPIQSEGTYRKWGDSSYRSVRDKFKTVAADFKQTETIKVTSTSQSMDQILKHLKPQMICSGWGFAPVSQISGTNFWAYKRSGSWAHNMTRYGYVKIRGNWYAEIKNSWGMNAHKNGDYFLVPAEHDEQWIRDAEIQTVGELTLPESRPMV